MRGLDLFGQQFAMQLGMAAPRVGLRIVEDHAVMAAGEAGNLVHVGVRKLLRPSRGVELAAYLLKASGAGPGSQ